MPRARNCFLKKSSDEIKQSFCKQRKKCVSLLRKPKKNYFTSFNEKHITESKSFCKNVTPFLSSKVQYSERRKPAEEDDTLITNEEEAAMKLNDFKNVKIPKFENFDLFSENPDYPTLKATVK